MGTTKYQVLQELLCASLERNAGNVAIRQGDQQVSYRELAGQASSLAGYLSAAGLGKGSLVGICCNDRRQTITAMLGTLLAGAVFVPLDPQLPSRRLEACFQATGLRTVLTGGEPEAVRLRELEERLGVGLQLHPMARAHAGRPAALPAYAPEDPVYIYFTSGSTGQPKPILGQNKSLLHFIRWEIEEFGVDESFRVSQFTHVGFDAFLRDVFTPLCAGASICIPPGNLGPGSGTDLRAWIAQTRITLVHCVPTFFRLLHHEDMRSDAYPDLKYVLLSGEKIFPPSLAPWYRTFGERIQLVNLYGPTETTMVKTCYRLRPGDVNGDHIPVGQAIRGSRVYLLDDQMKPVPPGAYGEVYIRTPYRTLGYFNQPEATRERFLPNPATGDDKDLFYRTGDIGRFLASGDLEISGRKDRQVKVRGGRVELDEVENALLRCPGVREAAVVSLEKGGETLLGAYYAGDADATPETLQRQLAAVLPEYMLPAWVVQLGALPLLANGKIDRKRLAGWEGNRPGAGAAATNDPDTQTIREMWAGLLGKPAEEIGAGSNFFELGGNSLKAIMLVARLHKAFQVLIPVKDLFANPTPAGIAGLIGQAQQQAFRAIAPAPRKEAYLLSSGQRRLHFLSSLNPHATVYNIPVAVDWEGDPDEKRLASAIGLLAQRHEALRTQFVEHDGEVKQQVLDAVHVPVESFEAADLQGAMARFVRPFVLSRAPLFRVGLVKTASGRHLLLADLHHLVGDGFSVALLVRDFTRLYAGETLPPLRLQYRDYAEWSHCETTRLAVRRQADYWRARYAGPVPVLELPADYPRSGAADPAGDAVQFDWDRQTAEKLNQLARETEATLFMVLLALYQVLLHKLSRHTDIVIGTPVAGRNHADLEPVVGMFVNMLALRNQVDPGQSFRSLLGSIRQHTLEAYQHQDYPYEDLVESVVKTREPGRNPLFDVVLVLQNLESPHAAGAAQPFRARPFSRNIAKFDLTLSFTETPEGISGRFEYRTSLFRRERIAQWIGYLENLVQQVTTRPDRKVQELSLLDEAEVQRLLQPALSTGAQFPEQATLVSLFEAAAARYPGREAVHLNGKSLTYAQLNEQANRLAHQLLVHGAGPEQIVALVLDRSLLLPAAILGVLKSGAAYLPVEPGLPAERKSYILENSRANLLLTDGTDTSFFAGKSLYLPDLATAPAPVANPSPATRPASLAYVIYTSGTTGKPKGVMIEHRNVVQLLDNDAFATLFTVGEHDAWSLFHSYSFDFSVWELFGALLKGGRLEIVPQEVTRDPYAFIDLLSRRRVTVLNQTPSAFYNLTEALRQRPAGLPLTVRYVIFGGEALQPAYLKYWQETYPGTVFVNMYGITETTVHVTYKQLTPADVDAGISNIGKPLPLTNCLVLDEARQPVAEGVTGELWVGGAGVARGYLHNEPLTRERFVAHPALPGQRFYRSGDLVRRLPNGELEYLGRNDQQVQLRGFRVELGEVEHSLLRSPGIRQAVVLARADERGDLALYACLVADHKLDLAAVRAHAAAFLPGYMVPGHFVQVPAIPLTANGKADREQLYQWYLAQCAGDADREEPTGEAEKKLAALWAGVLNAELRTIGATSSFFELGGHSLKVTQLASGIRKAFGRNPGIVELFRNATVRSQAARLPEWPLDEDCPIRPASPREAYPLSPAQRRLYVVQQAEPATTRYNVSLAVPVPGRQRPAALVQALEALVQRHEILRTVFLLEGEEPIQRVLPRVPVSVARVDGAGREPQELLASLVQPFRLHEAPLLRAALVRGAEEDVLFLDMHHIITDAISQQILAAELQQLLRGETLPPVALHYKDYAEWLRVTGRADRLARHREYWLGQLADRTPGGHLPLDYPRPAHWDSRGGICEARLEAPVLDALRQLAVQTGTTLYTGLLAAYGLLLARYAGRNDLVVGASVSGRSHPDTHRIVGKFVNLLPIRLRCSDGKSYQDYLGETAGAVREGLQHQDYPFDQLVADLGERRTPGRHPVFDAAFTLVHREAGGESWLDAAGPAGLAIPAKFDLLLLAVEEPGQVRLGLTFARALFEEATVARMLQHLLELLAQVTANPEAPLETISLSAALSTKNTFADDLLVGEFNF